MVNENEERIDFRSGALLLPGESITFQARNGERRMFMTAPHAVHVVAARRAGDLWWFVAADGSEYVAGEEKPAPPLPKPLKHHTFKAGQMLAISRGDYSSYRVDGFYQVLRDFDPYAERRRAAPKDLVAHLLADGYVSDVGYSELHMDDYGDVEDMYVEGH